MRRPRRRGGAGGGSRYASGLGKRKAPQARRPQPVAERDLRAPSSISPLPRCCTKPSVRNRPCRPSPRPVRDISPLHTTLDLSLTTVSFFVLFAAALAFLASADALVAPAAFPAARAVNRAPAACMFTVTLNTPDGESKIDCPDDTYILDKVRMAPRLPENSRKGPAHAAEFATAPSRPQSPAHRLRRTASTCRTRAARARARRARAR